MSEQAWAVLVPLVNVGMGLLLAASGAWLGYRHGLVKGYDRGREDQWLRDHPGGVLVSADGTRRTA